MMDWTGGTRRRFAPKKNNATLQRQKAYFAKARAALNAPSQRIASRSPTRRYSASVPRSSQHRTASRGNNKYSKGSNTDSRLSVRDSNLVHKSGQGIHETPYRTLHSANDRSRSPSMLSVQSQEQVWSHPALAPKDGMNEEERLLLANRRRLLAQNDWLGLAPARPVPTKGSSSHDKGRIGKRRKIENSRSNNGQPAGRRLLTPLFEERLQPQIPVMSGALPVEDFHVRIGTDAFATQTQPSRRSLNSGRTSMRQPSTDFDVLSEESMLLGPDDDNFDPLRTLHDSLVPQSAQSPHVQQLCEVANMSRSQYRPEGHERSEANTISPSQPEVRQGGHTRSDFDVNEQSAREFMLPDERLQQPNMEVVRPRRQSPATSYDQNNNSASDEDDTAKDSGCNQGIPPVVDEDDGDDQIWRKFMNVAQRTPSNPSMTALKSSSFHMTASESSHRPVFDHLDKPDQGTDTMVSTPYGAGTQGLVSLNYDQAAEPLTGSGSIPSDKLPSPSASLKQIINLATRATPPTAKTQEQRDENEIWREFICGSQDDSEASSQIGLDFSKEKLPADEAITLIPESVSYIVSDLGTSNRTTIGADTLMVEDSLPSANSQKCTTTSQRELGPVEDFASAIAQNSASNEDYDDDSIEDDATTSRRKDRSLNIHAPRTTKLNPKRFLPPQTRHRPPPKRSMSFMPPRGLPKKAPRLERSVYDLVDSDGNSVA